MKIVLVLALAIMIGGSACPALAEDGNNVIDQVGDILTGHNDSVPTNLSAEIAKRFNLGICEYQLGIEGLTPMGDNFAKEGVVTIRNRFLF